MRVEQVVLLEKRRELVKYSTLQSLGQEEMLDLEAGQLMDNYSHQSGLRTVSYGVG